VDIRTEGLVRFDRLDMHHRQLQKHRRKLLDIRNIMNSMKTLAAIETHKLERGIASQQLLVQSIEDMAADFLSFFPQTFPEPKAPTDVVIVIGSERGFCGDFNDRIVRELDQRFTETEQAAGVIAVGNKLEPLLQESPNQIAFVRGADVTEEIVSVLDSLATALGSHRQASSLCVLHHDFQTNEVATAVLLPPFGQVTLRPPEFSTPPLLNLPTMDFFLELIDHYLFTALHRILHLSLMAENQHRIQHLERATKHLDDSTEELGHRINTLRQEEIIEEIEVILLNATTGLK